MYDNDKVELIDLFQDEETFLKYYPWIKDALSKRGFKWMFKKGLFDKEMWDLFGFRIEIIKFSGLIRLMRGNNRFISWYYAWWNNKYGEDDWPKVIHPNCRCSISF